MKADRINYCWLLMVLLFSCPGCALFSGPGKYDLRLKRDAALADVAIQIDVIGKTQDEAHKEGEGSVSNINRYWARALRGEHDPNAIALKFSPGGPQDIVLSVSGKNETDK